MDEPPIGQGPEEAGGADGLGAIRRRTPDVPPEEAADVQHGVLLKGVPLFGS